MSETNIRTESSQNSSELRLTRRGKIAAAVAGIALTGGAIFGLSHEGADQPSKETGVEQTPLVPSEETRTVTVKQGEGVDDIVQRVYGIDAPDGMNQVVQNNPEYQEQVAGIEQAMGDDDVLQTGEKLELPVDYVPAEK